MKNAQITTLLLTATAALGLASCATSGSKGNSSTVPSLRPSTDSEADLEREVRNVHQEYDRAWLQQDATAFARLLAEDVTQTDPDGKVLSKAEIVANARSGDVKFEIGHSDDIKVRIYGTTAVVTARWTEKSTTKGKPFAGTTRNTVVYVKKNGHWKVVSDQVTLITAEQRP